MLTPSSLLQLNMAKDSETVLEGFQEGPLKFPPTYKFDVGTDTYDTRCDSSLITIPFPKGLP